jgi:hypothetical protein
MINMKETPRRSLTVTSSLNEKSQKPCTIRWGVRRGRKGDVTSPANTPFYKQASGHIFKDDVNGFSSTSGICFMVT